VSTLEWEQARQIVIDTVKALRLTSAAESVPLEQAHGRVLAEDLCADRDYPALRRSLRDGFAIQTRSVPGTLRVRGEMRAGEEQQAPLTEGEALEIMTGAPVPDEADAVVMVEHVTRVAGAEGALQVKIEHAVEPGKWINERGSEAGRGSLLVPKGGRLDAGQISALAMAGKSKVPVYVRPRVAILATGDEIVPVDATPEAHQIRNSNSFMLAALVWASGGRPEVLPVARDTPEALRIGLAEGLTHEMLVISGGVSAGRYDLVKPILRELGATFHFEGVRIQPGGPCAFGTRDTTAVFGLPGNPGSSYVTFQLFAQAALDVLGGQPDSTLPLLTARFTAAFKHRPGLTRFLPAKLSADGQHLTHIPWQGSSDVPALARANVFLVADDYRESWAAGDTIRVMRKL
jgi:molybdopterin molybdotransferase